jgi:hypothetical protein
MHYRHYHSQSQRIGRRAVALGKLLFIPLAGFALGYVVAPSAALLWPLVAVMAAILVLGIVAEGTEYNHQADKLMFGTCGACLVLLVVVWLS